jgi:hypothetical protein
VASVWLGSWAKPREKTAKEEAKVKAKRRDKFIDDLRR